MVKKLSESNSYKSFYEKLQSVWIDIYNLTFTDSDDPVYDSYLWDCRGYIEKAIKSYNKASDYLDKQKER